MYIGSISFYANNSLSDLYFSQFLEVDMDHEIARSDQSQLFVMVTGKSGTKSSQILVYCEHREFLQSKSTRDALLDLTSYVHLLYLWHSLSKEPSWNTDLFTASRFWLGRPTNCASNFENTAFKFTEDLICDCLLTVNCYALNFLMMHYNGYCDAQQFCMGIMG